jgi:hypothetical protein
MSSQAAYSHLFSFLLPDGARRDAGIVADSPYRCFVEVGRIGLVTVMGPSREAVFDQAARILRVACQGRPPCSISGTMYHNTHTNLGDDRDWLRLPGPADGWSIAVNAEVAFAPTGLGQDIPDLKRAARPALSMVKGDR